MKSLRFLRRLTEKGPIPVAPAPCIRGPRYATQCYYRKNAARSLNVSFDSGHRNETDVAGNCHAFALVRPARNVLAAVPPTVFTYRSRHITVCSWPPTA